jgi:hypothetical protein
MKSRERENSSVNAMNAPLGSSLRRANRARCNRTCVSIVGSIDHFLNHPLANLAAVLNFTALDIAAVLGLRLQIEADRGYPPAARTIARMPARIASGSVGQASMIVARAGSMDLDSGASAPDFAPPCPKSTVFAEICEEVRIPSSPLCTRTYGKSPRKSFFLFPAPVTPTDR